MAYVALSCDAVAAAPAHAAYLCLTHQAGNAFAAGHNALVL